MALGEGGEEREYYKDSAEEEEEMPAGIADEVAQAEAARRKARKVTRVPSHRQEPALFCQEVPGCSQISRDFPRNLP